MFRRETWKYIGFESLESDVLNQGGVKPTEA